MSDRLREHAIRLAGALAEAGVRSLHAAPSNGPSSTLHTRTTDLPGVILSAAPGWRCVEPGLRLVVERVEDGLRIVEAGTPEAARIAAAVEAPGD